MKKWIALLMVLVLMLGMTSALAEDGMGVQLIGGPETETEPVSLDDIKLNSKADIDGYATILPLDFFFSDTFALFSSDYRGYSDRDRLTSGTDADYALYYMDILNRTTTDKDFLSNCDVKVIFDDMYIYGGWAYQVDYNYPNWGDDQFPQFSNKQNMTYGIKQGLNFTIQPMYQGHYVFGCTLPNAVVTGKEPLRMVITIDGNEITYHIRK